MSYTKPNDWTEDSKHENGNYANACSECGSMFRGHKRRVICKLCARSQSEVIAEIRTMLADMKNDYVFGSRTMRIVMGLVDSQAVELHAQKSTLRVQQSALEVAADLLPKVRKDNEAQMQRVAELTAELESAKSLAGIATKRFFEAKENAEKYRNAYVDANARRDGHHPKSMLHAHLLPWERWDAETKSTIDLTETTDSKEVAR